MARTKLKSEPEREVATLPRTSATPWWIAWSFLAVLALAEVWLPRSRIGAHYEIGYNEGWNAYLQQEVADGARLYAREPVYAYANYPPLSFHLVGWAGQADTRRDQDRTMDRGSILFRLGHPDRPHGFTA